MPTISVDPDGLSCAATALRRAGAEISSTVPAVRGVVGSARSGAGELAGDLGAGLDAFELSWSGVLRALSASTGMVAGSAVRSAHRYRTVDAWAVAAGRQVR